MKNIILFALTMFSILAPVLANAQCYIMYDYNSSGYRTHRYYQCGNNFQGGQNFKKSPVIGSGNDTIIANICSLRPNPSNGRFSAELKYAVLDADVYITDIKGAVIVKKKMNGTEVSFDITQFASGIYALHLKSKDYEFDAKVLKE